MTDDLNAIYSKFLYLINSDDDPYCKLANAVILKAVLDYKEIYSLYLREHSSKSKIDKLKNELNKLEVFFDSAYFEILSRTRIDKDYILENIRKECAQESIKSSGN